MKTLFCLLGMAVAVATASAQFSNFSISLSANQEVPPDAGRTGSGSGTLTLDLSLNTLTFNSISWGGLSANSTAAHIHGAGGVGTNVGILYPLDPTFVTVGGTSGMIGGTLTLVNNPNGSGFSIAQQESQLESGLWYINIHSTAFPGGEIRGQILAVPEPSFVALFAVGGLLIVLARRLMKWQVIRSQGAARNTEVGFNVSRT